MSILILFIGCVSAVWWNPTSWDFGKKIDLSPQYNNPTTSPNTPINPNIQTIYNNPTTSPTQTIPTTIMEPPSSNKIVNTIPVTTTQQIATQPTTQTLTTTPSNTPTITNPQSQKDTGSSVNKVDTASLTTPLDKSQLEYACLREKGGYSCGPRAIKNTLDKFKIEYTTEEINKLRNEGGGFLRTTLSLFNKDAKQITWPSEMKDILKHYGLEVKNLDNNAELIRRTLEDQRDAVIISRIKEKAPFTDHWVVLEINEKDRTIIKDSTSFNGMILPSPDIEILETFIITKPKTN